MGLLREVFDFGLAEDDVGIAGRALVYVRLVDDEKNVFGFSNGHSGHSHNLIKMINVNIWLVTSETAKPTVIVFHIQ